MPTSIEPTAPTGQRRQDRERARQVWAELQPDAWASLTTAQRWEIVRRVLVHVVRQTRS